MKPTWWAILAVLAPALPMLLNVPMSLVSLVEDLGSASDAGNTAAPHLSTAIAVSVPSPLEQFFTQVTESGLGVVAPAVAFLLPARHRRTALLAAGGVLGALVLLAVVVTQTAKIGEAIYAGVLAACYAGAIFACHRAYRASVEERS